VLPPPGPLPKPCFVVVVMVSQDGLVQVLGCDWPPPLAQVVVVVVAAKAWPRAVGAIAIAAVAAIMTAAIISVLVSIVKCCRCKV
jgi:hypothetical protein